MSLNFPEGLLPDQRKMHDEAANAPGPALHELPPAELRQVYIGIMKQVDESPRAVAVVKELQIPGPAGPMPARLFDAKAQRGPGPIAVVIHGGGWIMGGLDIIAPFCTELTHALDIPVVAISYRLAPENKFPAAFDDCEAAMRWVASSPPELGRKATALLITGESAGGQLTISTTMALRDKPAAVPVIVHAPIVPIVDLTKSDYPSRSIPAKFGWNSEALAWCSGLYQVDPSDWRCSPLSGKLHDMPAAVVLTAEFDVLRDEGRAYAAALAEAGTGKVVYHEAIGSLHGFYLFRRAAPSVLADVNAFFALLKATLEAEAARLLPA